MAGVRRSLCIWSAGTRVAGGLLAVCALALAVSSSAVASPPRYELVKQFGTDGSETPSFEEPTPVAVDQQTHFVYAASGLPRGEGPAAIFKFDSEGHPVNWGGSAGYLSGNKLGGLQFSAERTIWRQVAVDSASHVIYINSRNSITAFRPDGEPANFSAGSGAGTNAIGGFSQLSGITVDSNGDIYASDAEGGAEVGGVKTGVVKIFAPSGAVLTQFTPKEPKPANLAVDSTGAVYVTRGAIAVTKYVPSPYPVTAATGYTAAPGYVDSANSPGSVGVNPANNDVYVVHGNPPGVSIYSEHGAPITTFGEPGTAGELNGPGGIAIDGATTRVYVGNRPGTGLSLVDIFRPEPPAAPKIELAAVGGVSSTSATLYARINPDQRDTTYRFEYGLGDCASSVCTAIPLGGASIPAGNDGVLVSQKISNLIANTRYHYRVIAENELGPDEQGGVFETQGSNLTFGLSDSRVWEMVSPPNKRGASLRGTEEAAGTVQAAADGNGIAYVTVGSLEEWPEGNRALEVSSVLARRAADGWHSKDISAPNAEVSPLHPGGQAEYKVFSTDLSDALLEPRSSTALSPEASERTPYLRSGDPATFRPLVTGKEGFANVPPETEFGGGSKQSSDVEILEATPDFDHVALRSEVPLVHAPGLEGSSLYEWTAGTLSPISVLPPAQGGGIAAANLLGSGGHSMRHAISDDGSRAFWTGSSGRQLYMRDMQIDETIRLDEVQGGTGEGEERPVFQGASSDGTLAFFTDFQRLTPDSGASFGTGGRGSADLYECEILRSEGTTECRLHDLTPKVGLKGADVQGIVSGLSDDGSRLYFAADGALVTGGNQFGDSAVAGQPNLYLWQKSGGLRFIATLSAEDSPDWGHTESDLIAGGHVSKLSTSNSPSGRYLAFVSGRDITGQGNVDVTSGEAVERVFRYDAGTGRLACVSCAPAGAAPSGLLEKKRNAAPFVDPREVWFFGPPISATVPGAEILSLGEDGEVAYQPRAALDNGRVFFNAFDSLVPADSNRQWDVYQYEDVGVGDCVATSGNADISRSGEGCVSLMSSGTAESEVGFLDASVNGNDVFFLSPARLAATDGDNEVDLYDARVGGTAAVPSLATECSSGDTCHPGASQAQEVAPGSSSFTGAGNVRTGKKCPKGKHKVRRGGKKRCVPNKGNKHRRRHKHAKGAGR